MEEFQQLIEKKGGAPLAEFIKAIRDEHIRLGLLPINEKSAKLINIMQFVNNLPPSEINNRLKYYFYVLSIILFPIKGSSPIPKIEIQDDRIICTFITYSLRNQIKLPLESFSLVFRRSLTLFSFTTPFYQIKPIFYFQRVPEILKEASDVKEIREYIQKFFEVCISFDDLSNINHSTILFFDSMIQSIIQYIYKYKQVQFITQCNVFFTHIFTLQSVSPSIIVFHFLHLWYAFNRFCTQGEFKVHYEPQIHLISDIFKRVSTSQKHELYRFFHWNLFVAILMQFEDQKLQFNSLCLVLTFYKTIPRIDSMRIMVDPSREFLSQLLEQYDNKSRFSFFTVVSFFDSCFKDFLKLISNSCLIVINSSSEKLSEKITKPIKISFSEQLKYIPENHNNRKSKCPLLDDSLFSIVNEKIVNQSDFSQEFESLIAKCDLLKTRITTARYFLFPCFVKLSEDEENLPYVIQMIKTLMQMIFSICRALFFIYHINMMPNKNPDLTNIIQQIIAIFNKIPNNLIPYVSMAISKEIFKGVVKSSLTANVIDVIQSFPEILFTTLVKDMIQIILTNQKMIFSRDYESTFSICRFIIFTARTFSVGAQYSVNKDLLSIFKKTILQTIFNNIRKISNQVVVFKMLQVFIKHFQLDSTHFIAKPSQFEDVLPNAKRDFLFPFLSLLPSNIESLKLNLINPILEFALKSGDKDSIEIASKLCMTIYSVNSKNRILADSHYLSLYQAWRNADLPKEHRDKMIETIPFYANAFTQQDEEKINGTITFSKVYECISKSMSMTTDSVYNAFTVFKNSILSPDLRREETIPLLNIYISCISMRCMREKIESFTPIMLKYHTDLFINDVSNVFFLCLLEVTNGSISYLSNEIHDLSVTFIKTVIQKDAMCPMLEKTVSQLLYVFPQKERVYSILSGLSLFVKYCPSLVTVELIRTFLIASNEVYLFDVYFNKSLYQLLHNYISVASQETKEELGEVIFTLFSSMPISYRLVIVQIIQELNCKPPEYEIYQNSQFKTLELQKITASLLFDREITPNLIDFIKKIISDKNEPISLIEKLSRRMSLIYGSVVNEHNFSLFINDQSFAFKLVNFISNSIASGFKTLRKIAKKCFSILIQRIDKEKKISFINDQFDNPLESKVFSFYGDRVEKISYFKRLMTIKPSSINSNLVLNFIDAIGSYLKMNDDDKNRFIPNLKVFFSFLGSKQLIQIPGIKEAISTIAIHHTNYFMYFIENYQKLIELPRMPYFTLAGKPSFNFLINFPGKTVKAMLQSPHSHLLYYLYMDLIDFEDSKPFHDHFIRLCKMKDDDPFLYPLFFFDIINKMSKIKSCVENGEFLDLIDFIIEQFYLRFYNVTNNIYFILFKMISTLSNTFKYVEDINRFIHLLRSFELPLFYNTHSYTQIIKRCIKRSSSKFKLDLITYLISNKGIVSQSIFDNALQHTIKELKDIPDKLVDDTWAFLIDTNYIYSMVRLVQYKSPSDEIIEKIVIIIKKTLFESNTENLIHSLKMMVQLIKLKKLPADVYWTYIKQCFLVFKFMDPPFAKHTFQLLKLMNENFPDVPDDIVEVFMLLVQSKSSLIREIQRIIEILFCAKPLCNISPFSPVILVSSFLEAEIPNKKAMPSKASFDCLLSIGIKSLLAIETPKEISEKFLLTSYRYIELMINGLPYNSFFDNISSYSIDHDLPNPPESLIAEISDETIKFQLPSFVIFCIYAKNQPEQAMKRSKLVENSLFFIQESSSFIHYGLLQRYIALLCTKEQYVQSVFNTYLVMLKNASLKNKQKIFQIIFSMMKTKVMKEHYEQMWDFLIDKEEKDAYLYLSEEEQVRYTRYILSKCHDKEMFIIQTANTFINNDHVSKRAKSLLISNIASYVNYSNADLIFDCVENIERFGKLALRDYSTEIADILIEAARCSSNLYRLKYLRKLGLIVPNDIDSKLHFVFNSLPLQSWRNETIIYVLSVFATDLKKWLPIFSFGNALQSIASEFVVSFLQPLLNQKTIKLFSDFFSNILAIDDKSHFDKIINGITYCFYNTSFPIHPKVMAKAAVEIGHPEYLTDYLDSAAVFSDHLKFFLPNYLNDYIYGKFNSDCSLIERAAMAASLLNKYRNASSIYSQIDLTDAHSIVSSFWKANDIDNLFMPSNVNKNYDLSFLIQQIGMTTLSFDSSKLPNIESLLNKTNEQLISIYKPGMSFFKQEIFVLIEAAIQIEKYFIEKKFVTKPNVQKVSLESFSFVQSLNPALISMLSNFRGQIKTVLGFSRDHLPEIQFDPENPPVLLVPSTLVKKFKKISGMTNRGLSTVNVDQINDFLNSMELNNPPSNKNLVQMSSIFFEIFLISPSDDLFKAAYYSYSQLIQKNNLSVPLFIRQQAGARLLFLLENAKTKDNFKVITANSSIFERKDLDIWRLWLTQLVILSKKKEIECLISPLFLEMGYRTLLYARRMNLKEIENYLTMKIPTSLLPLDKLGAALDIAFDGKPFDNNADRITSLINRSLPFVFPLYKSQMSIYQMSGQPRYLSDNLILLTLSTTLNCYTPILIQKTSGSNSDRVSLVTKTLSNTMYMMNLVIRYSYSTKIRNLELCVPFVFEIGDKYLMTVMNGQFIYLKDIYEKALNDLKKKNDSNPPLNNNTISNNNNTASNTNNTWNNDIKNFYYMSNFWSNNSNSYDIMSIDNSGDNFWNNNESNSNYANNTSNNIGNDVDDDDSLINLFNADFSFPSDVLLKYISEKCTKSEFVVNCHSLLRSYTSQAAVRYIFSSGYLSLKKMVMYLNPGLTPTLQIDYENNILVENTEESSIRYSPNIYKLFGERVGVSMLQIGMAAVASSFIENLETIRSYLEVLIWDRLFNSFDEINLSDIKNSFNLLIQERNKFEEKIISLAPPSGMASSPSDFTDWISNLDDLIEKAMNINIQPASAIPWF
ncbi:hypothetical protein M9Y10_024095 [Tritrichomonas musculus]|uniref:Non-specific serine/threonine protein kinase n=1 Tax=Tritrichomonas musculus TaxID=1915356 RepID=A0ABR2L039_9EUKA